MRWSKLAQPNQRGFWIIVSSGTVFALLRVFAQ
jgi:hypothetical protein